MLQLTQLSSKMLTQFVFQILKFKSSFVINNEGKWLIQFSSS